MRHMRSPAGQERQGRQRGAAELTIGGFNARVAAGFEDLVRGFPDWHWSILDMVADGDAVVVLTRASGTHRGDPTPSLERWSHGRCGTNGQALRDAAHPLLSGRDVEAHAGERLDIAEALAQGVHLDQGAFTAAKLLRLFAGFTVQAVPKPRADPCQSRHDSDRRTALLPPSADTLIRP